MTVMMQHVKHQNQKHAKASDTLEFFYPVLQKKKKTLKKSHKK